MISLSEILLGSRESGKKFDYIDHRSHVGVTIIPNSVLLSDKITASERDTLIYLMMHNWYNYHTFETKGFVFMSIDTMCEEKSLAKSTLLSRLDNLEEKGIIYRLSNTSYGYKDSLKYLNDLCNLNIWNTTVIFIDLFDLLKQEEVCFYLQLDAEEYQDLRDARKHLMESIRELDTCENEFSYNALLEDIHMGHIQYETPHLKQAKSKGWDKPNSRGTKSHTEGGTVFTEKEGVRGTENHTQSYKSSLNVKNKENNSAEHSFSSSPSKANYFRNLNDVKKEDVNQHFDVKKQRESEKQKREQDRVIRQNKQQEQLLDKLTSKDYDKFTLDDVYLYIENKINEVFKPDVRFRTTEEKKKEFRIRADNTMKSENLDMKSFILVIDTYISMYQNNEIKGQNSEKFKYPIPNFLFAVIKQILNKLSLQGGGSKGSEKSTVFYTASEETKTRNEDVKKTRADLLQEWASDWKFSFGETELLYGKYIQWAPRTLLAEQGVPDVYKVVAFFIVRGLLAEETKATLASKDTDWTKAYILATLKPAYEDYYKREGELSK